MIIDAITYVGIALLTAFTAFLGSDDAAKYIDAQTLFWMKGATNWLNGGLIALKMFRSETYSNWKLSKNGNGKENGHAKTNGNGGGVAVAGG